MIVVDVIGAQGLANHFRAASARIQADTPLWLIQSGELTKSEIQTTIWQMGLFRTGRLYDSGRVFNAGPRHVWVGFGQGARNPRSMPGKQHYAPALEGGARPHPITAKRVKMLHFYWEEMGMMYTGERVMHPGVHAYHFMTVGAERSLHGVVRLFFERIYDALAMP